MVDRRIEKLINKTIKKRDLEALLKKLGFQKKSGKGSHQKWIKQGVDPIILASHSKDLKPYMIDYVLQKLQEAKLLKKK